MCDKMMSTASVKSLHTAVGKGSTLRSSPALYLPEEELQYSISHNAVNGPRVALYQY